MRATTSYERCQKCGKLFSHRKSEIIDEVNSGVYRGVDGFYCWCGGKIVEADNLKVDENGQIY
jgi:uncharacterized protein with PIN domain